MGSVGVALPFVGMVMAECAQVGLMIVGKIAMSKEMSNLVFIFYSNAFASLILLPSSFLIHRSQASQRPPLTFSILSGFFLLGLLGSPAARRVQSPTIWVADLGRRSRSQSRPVLSLSVSNGSAMAAW
uniref:WAT1-related protein n=1 Tax=Fagus sylvatica TaxID=28930 RepID=A0A2N9JAD9_FAGSY